MAKNMTMSIKIDGLKELERKVEDMPDRINRGRDKGLIAAALIVQNQARRLVQKGPKSGRIYKRRGIHHQASAPGEAPATDNGDLVRGIVADPQPERGSISVHSRAIQSFWLELGTRLMAPRPFMLRSLLEMADRCKAVIKKYVAAELNYD